MADSIGERQSKPKSKNDGFSPVELWGILRYAQRAPLRYWSHCAPIFAACFLSIDLRVLLNLSSTPLHCGWLAVVFNFLIPSSLQTSFIKNDSKFVPRSDRIASGTPNIGTISSTSNRAMRSAFWSGVGKTRGHFK